MFCTYHTISNLHTAPYCPWANGSEQMIKKFLPLFSLFLLDFYMRFPELSDLFFLEKSLPNQSLSSQRNYIVIVNAFTSMTKTNRNYTFRLQERCRNFCILGNSRKRQRHVIVLQARCKEILHTAQIDLQCNCASNRQPLPS